MNWWDSIINYYQTIGERYKVDPIVFVGIHVIATPLFAASVAWILANYRKKRSIVLPSVVATFIFNAANIYLVIFGTNILLWIYIFIITTTIITGYVSIRKIKKKMLTYNK